LLAERSNGTFSIPVDDILDNGANTVVVLATHSAQRDDRGLAMPAVYLWRFMDGKVTSHESFVSDVFAQDESGRGRRRLQSRGEAGLHPIGEKARQDAFWIARIVSRRR
jgi:hypothetical protein